MKYKILIILTLLILTTGCVVESKQDTRKEIKKIEPFSIDCDLVVACYEKSIASFSCVAIDGNHMEGVRLREKYC